MMMILLMMMFVPPSSKSRWATHCGKPSGIFFLRSRWTQTISIDLTLAITETQINVKEVDQDHHHEHHFHNHDQHDLSRPGWTLAGWSFWVLPSQANRLQICWGSRIRYLSLHICDSIQENCYARSQNWSFLPGDPQTAIIDPHPDVLSGQALVKYKRRDNLVSTFFPLVSGIQRRLMRTQIMSLSGRSPSQRWSSLWLRKIRPFLVFLSLWSPTTLAGRGASYQGVASAQASGLSLCHSHLQNISWGLWQHQRASYPVCKLIARQ